MLLVNDLVVRGEPSEIDLLVKRIDNIVQDAGWKREPDTEKSLREWGIGRHGVYCFSRGERSGLPAVSLHISRTGPGQLSSAGIVPTQRRPLMDEEYNQILGNFKEEVLEPLRAITGVSVEIVPPRLTRLEVSISPEALRRLNRFAMMNTDRRRLTPEDRSNWRDFAYQVYSDGSMLEAQDLGPWLVEQGWSQEEARQMIARLDVERLFEHQGLGI